MSKSISRAQFSAATAATFASIAILKSPARAAQFQYKFASNVPPDYPLNVRMKELWAAVKQETGGRLDVAIFPNNELGGDTEMLSQLRSGALQFFTLDGGILQSVVPVAGIQGVGFAFKDSPDAFAAFDGPLGGYVRKEIAAKGLYAFPKMWENGMREITTSTKPIRTADDLNGLRIRTPAGKLWVDLFKALGASPTPMNFNEVYTSLQTHVIDAQENPYAIIEVAKLYEVQKNLSVTNHMWSAFWFLSNGDAWKALPPDIQAAVERNAAKYALLDRADTMKLNDSLAAKLKTQGMAINVAETESFRKRLGSFYAYYRGQFGQQAWSLLEAHSGKLG
ncbi:MAG: TRAP transporter substrate-binding protein [Vulcanimicrobiaceae bacterium]